MILVVDASVAYGLLCGPAWDTTVNAAEEVLAPDLIAAEVLNARWKVARSGAIAPALETTLELLTRFRLVSSAEYVRDAALLADRLDHPVYDCLYVSVAQRERAKLLTGDQRFARKLRASKLGGVLLET